MRVRFLLPLAALLAFSLPATAARVDSAKSEITFVSRQMNVPVRGIFKKFSAVIAFDPTKLAFSKADIEVELASIDTGSADADEEVAKKAWFNISAFPIAKFSSTSVKQTGPNRYEARGTLSIKGIGKGIAAPFTVKRSGNLTTYEGGFSLKRLQFNIGEGPWSDTETVADEVEVKFRIVTTGDK